MKIGIASDHRGYELKQKIIKDMKGIEFVDFGTDSDKSVDYPDYAFKLCTGIINKKVPLSFSLTWKKEIGTFLFIRTIRVYLIFGTSPLGYSY